MATVTVLPTAGTLQQQFLNHLRFEKRYPQNTVSNYETDLRQFEQFLQRLTACRAVLN